MKSASSTNQISYFPISVNQTNDSSNNNIQTNYSPCTINKANDSPASTNNTNEAPNDNNIQTNECSNDIVNDVINPECMEKIKKKENDKPVIIKNDVNNINNNKEQSNYINIVANQHLIVNLNDYEKKSLLGNGKYGQVFIVEEKSTGKQYAAKTSINNNQKTQEDLIQEICFYSRYKFPFILSIHGYSLTDFNGKNRITMILDYMPIGSLDKFFGIHQDKKNLALTKPQKYLILYGIVIGMKYLHSQDVVHRDLKPANILLDENYYPRISDFGLAIIYSDRNKIVKKQEQEKAGSLMYMAPEIFLDKDPYSFKVDVYAFSMIAYQLMTDVEPYSERNYKLVNKFKKDVIDGVRPDLSFIPDLEIQSFFKQCWSHEPTERPSFLQIYEIITSLKFKSIFQVDESDITKLDYWCENISNPFNVDQELLYLIKKAKCLLEINPTDVSAMTYLKHAADLGNVKAMITYSKLVLKGPKNRLNDDTVLAFLLRSIKLGEAEGMFYYGQMLELGRGVKKDLAKANQYYKMAADLGFKEGAFQYAYNIENGIGNKINYKKASKYYKIASFYGDYYSLIRLGKMYYNGELQYDLDQSIHYLKEALKFNNDQVYFEYGKVLMIQVMNGKEEINQPINYFLKSIEKVNSDASFSYGNILLTNSLFNFLDNSNTIKDSSKYFELSLKSKKNKFSESHHKLLTCDVFKKNEVTIQEKDLETLIIRYGILILKNTMKNHELIIDCLFYFKSLKQFKQEQYSNYLQKILKQDIFKKLSFYKSKYLKYIIQSIDDNTYYPYVEKKVEEDLDEEEEKVKKIPIEKVMQTVKDIQKVEVNIYESFVLDAYCCFSFSQTTISKSIQDI